MAASRESSLGFRLVLTVLAAILSPAPAVWADSFDAYRRVGQFTLPAGTAAFDALPDGRLIAISGASVFVETGVRTRQFSSIGVLTGADIPSFGAAFLRVSPNGSRMAIGNNGGAMGNNPRVGIFTIAGLSGQWFSAEHFDAGWVDVDRLAITYGDFVDPSIVTVLNVNSANPENPDSVIVVDGIGGASAGVAFDAVGNLYTGNGFTFDGPSGTGAVRAFAAAAWGTAFATETPLDFETQGNAVVDVLSASPLGFDEEGNLLVAGGDFSQIGQSDFVAIARAPVVAMAAAGGPPVNTDDAAALRRLDPDGGNDSNFYTVGVNRALSEIYVRDFGNDTVFVYLDTTNIPATSNWGMVCLALASLCAGTILTSRGHFDPGSVGP